MVKWDELTSIEKKVVQVCRIRGVEPKCLEDLLKSLWKEERNLTNENILDRIVMNNCEGCKHFVGELDGRELGRNERESEE